MERQPTVQQITWFLDIDNTNQLNIAPPYQRKSVWTKKDRKYFLDTIFRNYPCPTIFIHKQTDEDGKTTYNVVDGKQRLQTILMFRDDEIRIDKDFGDSNLNGKKFSELSTEQKKKFWDYILVVDFVQMPDSSTINEVFDRLNRNSKNLNNQELRHAKYNGWFITEVEKEVDNSFWENVKISTKTKARRMKDIQFISELMMVIIEKNIVGFSQDHIDAIYADYDNLDNSDNFDEQDYIKEKERIRKYLENVESENKTISTYATTANNFYTLWSLISLTKEGLPDFKEFSKRYIEFIKKVNSMSEDTDEKSLSDSVDKSAYQYYTNSRGASTDLKQRKLRLESLRKTILLQ